MKYILQISLILFLSLNNAFPQKAREVIENGIPVKKGEALFLQFKDDKLKYDIAKSAEDPTNPLHFVELMDSSIFLPVRSGIAIFMRPLNPLNYASTSEQEFIPDQINQAAADALGEIGEILTSTIGAPDRLEMRADFSIEGQSNNDCQQYKNIVDSLSLLQKELGQSKKAEIVRQFKKLKSMTFMSMEKTMADYDKVVMDIEKLSNHFKKLDSIAEKVNTTIEKYSCTSENLYTVSYLFKLILKDLNAIKAEQRKRLNNLFEASKLIETTINNAAIENEVVGMKWCTKLADANLEQNKVTIYKLTVKEAGYKLSDKEEIVKIESGKTHNKTLRFRKFQRFVPEVSAGIAYTNFTFNTYGTTTDTTGQQFIANPTETSIKNINVSAMLNFTYFIPNSTIHPLYQLGLGINSEIPTLLTGIGIRSNVGGIKRFVITGGFATTWLRELDSLSIGDGISGTDDIEKDLKYQFLWPPKGYIGIQYNF